MTLEKLKKLIEEIEYELPLHGCQINCTGGGELVIDLSSQPSRGLHGLLLRRGFITNDSSYVYRPNT